MAKPIFSDGSLRDWLRSKDPKRGYAWLNVQGCLLFQYLKDRGLPIVGVGSVTWLDDRDISHQGEIPRHWAEIAGWPPWTFGAALKRLEERMGQRP